MMMTMKLIVFYIFVCVNGLNIVHTKGMSRYRKSIVLNVANTIQYKSCPLLEHIDHIMKKSDNNKIVWAYMSHPWDLEYYDEIEALLTQEGEVPIID